MTPDRHDFWFLPLGGCGEIGMNMNLYGHDDQWLMVDCGVTFRDQDGTNNSGFHVQMADPDFITTRSETLQGLLLTHAHEDHIGAVPHLWPKLRCPVFATEFTAEMLRRKLVEHNLADKVPIRVVQPQDRFKIGVFDVEWVAHTHSIPDPCGLVIRTCLGSAFHTADWKLDKQPQVGHHYSKNHYQQIGDSGISAMICDSTCADKSGHSLSESVLYNGLHHHISQASGRVIVACFGSNIGRLETVARAALATNRHLGLLGRSLLNTVSAARAVGLWDHPETLVDAEHLGYLPSDTVLLVATGSQGEPRTALNRLSHGRFTDMALEPGDTVIYSARAIPGNEPDIDQMNDRLRSLGVNIITPESSELPIHASGHPSEDELAALYGWIKPNLLIPVHGEQHHMQAQTRLAKRTGIRDQLCGKNGDLFRIAPSSSIQRLAVECGRLGVTRKGLMKIDKANSTQTL